MGFTPSAERVFQPTLAHMLDAGSGSSLTLPPAVLDMILEGGVYQKGIASMLYLRVFVPMGGEQWDPTGKETHTPSFNNSRRRKKAHYMLENQPTPIILVTKPVGGHCRFQTCSTGRESRDGQMRFSLAHITDFVNAPAIVAPCIVVVFC